MAILANIVAETTSTDSGFLNPIEANVTVPAAPGFGNALARVDSTVLEDLSLAVKPRTVVQQVGVKVTLDGVDITDSMINAAWSCTRQISSAVQQAVFTFGIIDGQSPLGNVMNMGAPATGLKPIVVSLVYRGGATLDEYEVPLLTGVADDTPLTAAGSVIHALTVVDRGRIYRDARSNLVIPAGSNLPRETIARRLAEADGVPPAQISMPTIPGTVAKDVRLLEGSGLSLANDIAAIPGYHVLWSPEGELTALSNAAEEPRPVVSQVFNEQDIIRSVNGAAQPFIVRVAPEAWTEIELRGQKQVLRESCGLSTINLRSFGLVDEVGPAYPFLQASASGAVSDTGIGVLTGSRVGSRTSTQVTFRCRDMIAEKTTTWALLNPTRARYRKNADGSQIPAGGGGYLQVYLDEDGADGTAIGHFYPRPRLIKVSEHRLSHIYVDGVRRRTERTLRGWYNPRQHIKSRASTATSWEVSEADGDYFDLGNGEAVTTREDSFILLERETTEYTPTADNVLKNRRRRLERYAVKEGGNLYLYGNGTESSDPQEKFRLVQEVEESWHQINEQLVSTRVNEYGIDRKWLRGPSAVQLGAAPAAELLEDATPTRSDFETDEEFEAAKAASIFEQEEIKASCEIQGLENIRPPRRMGPALFEWAETSDELANICDRLLLEGISPEIEFSIPVNGLLREGDWIHVRNRTPGVGVDHDCKVLTVVHSGAGIGPHLTRVVARVWADRSQVGRS